MKHQYDLHTLFFTKIRANKVICKYLFDCCLVSKTTGKIILLKFGLAKNITIFVLITSKADGGDAAKRNSGPLLTTGGFFISLCSYDRNESP